MAKLRFTGLYFLTFISIVLLGYFGVNQLLHRNYKRVDQNMIRKSKVEKTLVVDTLLVVVDTLQVRADSSHSAKVDHRIIYVPQDVDTVAIIHQYYSKYRRFINYRNKDLDFNLSFDLYQNEVVSPKLKYKILRPIKIITKQTNRLYVGLSMGGSAYELQQFTPEVLYFTKNNRHGFKIGYNLLDQNRNIQIGYYFKLK